MKIVILMATMTEAKPFVTGFKMEQKSEKPFLYFEKDGLLLLISGIGKANAAMAVTYAQSLFAPAWICNLGAAGALNPEARRGEVFHVDRIIEHDRTDPAKKDYFRYEPDLLPGFDKKASLATGDNAVIKAAERNRLASVADLVDMEGAAIVQACKRFNIRGFLFKFVSDTHLDPEESIIENIRNLRQDFFIFFADSILPKMPVEQPVIHTAFKT